MHRLRHVCTHLSMQQISLIHNTGLSVLGGLRLLPLCTYPQVGMNHKAVLPNCKYIVLLIGHVHTGRSGPC
jgi:hypothetical protein